MSLCLAVSLVLPPSIHASEVTSAPVAEILVPRDQGSVPRTSLTSAIPALEARHLAGSPGPERPVYVYGPLYVDQPIQVKRGASTYYLHADQMFSVQAVTDANGAVVERVDYTSIYGEHRVTDNSGVTKALSAEVGNPWRFQGRRWDEESGLYYFRARYLDPVEGRFLSRDPKGVWSDAANQGNAYSFAGGDPVNKCDPFGLDTMVLDRPTTRPSTSGPTVDGKAILRAGASLWSLLRGSNPTPLGTIQNLVTITTALVEFTEWQEAKGVAHDALLDAYIANSRLLLQRNEDARNGVEPAWIRIFRKNRGRPPTSLEIDAFNNALLKGKTEFEAYNAAQNPGAADAPNGTPGTPNTPPGASSSSGTEQGGTGSQGGGGAGLTTKPPADMTLYPKHPDSRPFGPDLDPGEYVYVRDADGTVHVAPNGPHMHPKVLGNAQRTSGAGTIKVGKGGVVKEVTNASGTFKHPPETIPGVIEQLGKQGGDCSGAAVKPIPWGD